MSFLGRGVFSILSWPAVEGVVWVAGDGDGDKVVVCLRTGKWILDVQAAIACV